jgi:hypothetical protein
MGYIGLLLNAPYKIDRMMGDCLIYFAFCISVCFLYLYVGYMNERIFWGVEAKKRYSQGLGFRKGSKEREGLISRKQDNLYSIMNPPPDPHQHHHHPHLLYLSILSGGGRL